MDIPKTKTMAYTKYDTVVEEVEMRIPIPDIETPDFSMTGCYFVNTYRLSGIEQGVEDVIFAHYDRISPGITIIR